MSIFATVAVVCTMSLCNEYHVETADNLQSGIKNTKVIDDHFLSVWGDEKDLTNWLKSYKIGETVFEIVSIEFETQEIENENIP